MDYNILSLDNSFIHLIRKLKFIYLILTCTNLLSQSTINVDYLIVAGGGGGASGGGGAGGVLQGVDYAIPINTNLYKHTCTWYSSDTLTKQLFTTTYVKLTLCTSSY